ncbi:MAG: ATP-binding protein [Myxococcota bacterium]|nr:ATP-binding protein [Myxococcota bacterium]
MSPEQTRWIRRGTASAAVLWAVMALVLALYGQVQAPRNVDPPLQTTALGGNAIVQSVTPEAAAAGVRVGERVLRVDGRPVHRWYRERGWEDIRANTEIVYELVKTGGRVYEVRLTPSERASSYQRLATPLFLALVVVGSVYLAVGLFVWRLRPDRAEAWAFLLSSAFIATALFGAVHTYDAPFGHERMLMTLPMIGASVVHLFTTFPAEPPWVTRYRRARAVPYGLAALLALGVLLGVGMEDGWLPVVNFVAAFSGAVAGIAILIRERMRMRGSGGTESADIVLIGALVSFAPVAIILVLRALISGLPVSMPLAMLWFIGFPVAVGYGIVRTQLFDIRGIARSSAAYGAATLAITGLFASLITFADAAFRRFNVNADSPYFSIVFLFFAILAFNPLRLRLQSLVDRLFDRDRAGYRDAVREISEAMVSMLSLSEISERLLLAVTDTMGVERAMVLLLSEDERKLKVVAWRGEFEPEARELELPVDHPIGKHLWMRRQELSRADFDDGTDPETREICRDVFDTLDVKLLVPILFGVDLLGVVAVAGKVTGERLGPDDRQLLRTLSNQSAIAIENAQAFDEIAKLNETLEARVEERTQELQDTQTQLMQSEKMRSLGQLVAGVAHELNNPIGFVHANLQLLDGYIGKLVDAQEQGGDYSKPREAIGKLLARSREGTERVKKIVLDLRTFSRMDQAEISDTDLNEEIERTLGLMEARLKDAVTVDKDFGAIPRVRCFPAQLNQVFMNLVMNACDAIDGRGTLAIRTSRSPMGVRLEFEDDGPGIPEDVRGRIFEPFFTTKPVGQGTGLGLSISHGIVERHGGRMQVECGDQGGTLFQIDLPLVASPPDEEAMSLS